MANRHRVAGRADTHSWEQLLAALFLDAGQGLLKPTAISGKPAWFEGFYVEGSPGGKRSQAIFSLDLLIQRAGTTRAHNGGSWYAGCETRGNPSLVGLGSRQNRNDIPVENILTVSALHDAHMNQRLGRLSLIMALTITTTIITSGRAGSNCRSWSA